MNSFCETIFRCPTLFIFSNQPINESLIPDYNNSIKSDDLIKQLLNFLRTKLNQEFLICVKGSDLVYFNNFLNIDLFLVELRRKASNPLVKAIFEDHENDKEFLSDRIYNVMSSSNVYQFLNESVKEKSVSNDYKYLYKVTLVESKSGKAGSIKELVTNKLYLGLSDKVSSLVCTFNQGEANMRNKDEMIENFNRILEKNNYPHLVIFGLQECALDVIPDLMRDKYNRIGTGSLSQYFLNTKYGLGFMYLHIFVKKMEKVHQSQLQSIKEITIESMNASTDSCGKITEKKGSIVIPIKITCGENSTIINFVNVHLPSNPRNIEARNNCLIRSTQRLTDTTFVFGDMNYRTSDIDVVPQLEQSDVINESNDCGCSKDTTTYIKNKLKSDQLIKELQKKELYQFKEAPISFCPSCRYREYNDLKLTRNKNRCNAALPTDNVEMSEIPPNIEIGTDIFTSNKVNSPYIINDKIASLYDTKRYPSWCDRILYKIKYNNNFTIEIDNESYDSEHVTMMSDHALVSLKFLINIKCSLKYDYYDKYLKYKQKYLKLKNKYNHL